ncbi:MAG: hypothetical protein M3Z00_08175 [Actinomycetota bacterium]|nr:hypothetical protein [Actinomycetota bacterium]
MVRGAIGAGTIGLAAVAVISLVLALSGPMATTAVALMAFGVLHNVLELRYIGGRYVTVVSSTLIGLLVALATGIVLTRILGVFLGGGAAIRAEIVLTYAIIAAAAWFGLRRYPLLLTVSAVILTVAAGASLLWPAYHVVVITHLHNLIPLAFLWEFSRMMPDRARRAFRSVQVGWVLVIPALLLAGVFDSLVGKGTAAVRLFNSSPAVIAAGVTPPGTDGTTIGARFIAVFAFMQLLHFVVWIWYLPRFAPSTTAAFERRVPWLRGWRTWAVGLGAAATLGLLFVVDYQQGRTVYSALATYHAYLELPVLLIMFVGAGSMLGTRGQSSGDLGPRR